MTELNAQGKFIDTKPIKSLFTQGEHFADKIRITIPQVNNEINITDCTFTMRTVSFDGAMTETVLTKEILDDSLVLVWIVSRETTASAGVLYLQLIGSMDETVVIKYTMPPVIVGESVMGDNVPVPDVVDAKLTLMNELLEQFKASADGLGFAPTELSDARTGSIVKNTFSSLSNRLTADFNACITQGELEKALANVTAAYTKADKAVLSRTDYNAWSTGLYRKNLLEYSVTYGWGDNTAEDFGDFNNGDVTSSQGVTYTKAKDGSITASGHTWNQNTRCYLYKGKIPDRWLGRALTLTGTPPDSECCIDVHYRGVTTSFIAVDNGEGATFTFDPSISSECEIYIHIRYREDAVNGLTFYPMLRYADVDDDTYEPLLPSIQEQIDTLKESTATKDMLAIPAKNLCIPVAEIATKNGIIITRDYDGKVHLSGTSTSTGPTILTLGSVSVKSGTSYTISGCPGTGSASTYWVDLRTSGGAAVGGTTDTGSGAMFTAPEDNMFYYSIRIAAKANVDGLVFSPMVRDSSDSEEYVPYRPDVQAQLDALGTEIAALKAQLSQ